MTRRSKNSAFEDFVLIASSLPWWLCLILAAFAWFGLHALAMRPIAPPMPPTNLSTVIIAQLVRTAASAAQYLVPMLLVAGALVSIAGRWQRRTLFDSIADSGVKNTVQGLTWQQFEQLTGEAFRRRGFTVTENATLGADAGIDLRLHKNGEKYLVQCKQWRALKVGVGVVRELYGVMAAEGATGGFVVTSGRFTKEACDFAQGRNMELIDGTALQQWIQTIGKVSQINPVDISVDHNENAGQHMERAVSCPRCQATMVRRTAKRGSDAGNSFWGCSIPGMSRNTMTDLAWSTFLANTLRTTTLSRTSLLKHRLAN
jgi:restriction system protein